MCADGLKARRISYRLTIQEFGKDFMTSPQLTMLDCYLKGQKMHHRNEIAGYEVQEVWTSNLLQGEILGGNS